MEMKNGTEAIRLSLKADDQPSAKELAAFYNKCITELRIPKTWREANIVIMFKKLNRNDVYNCIPITICCISNIYKLFTKILTTWLEKKLDENQPMDLGASTLRQTTTMQYTKLK